MKPEIHQDEAMAGLGDSAFRLFIGCITFSDDEGRLRGDPRLLASQVWPYQAHTHTPEEVEKWLAELDRASLIQRYAHASRPLIFLPGFQANQRIDKAQESRLPSPDHPDSEIVPRALSGSSKIVPPRKGREGKGEERKGKDVAADRADAPLSHLLADLIVQNGSRRPRVGKPWITAERLLLDRDKRDRSEAEQLIRWCQASSFWRPNILSMPKFREKYDTLRLQRIEGDGGKAKPDRSAYDADTVEAKV